jgi:predicted transcriptional regulator
MNLAQEYADLHRQTTKSQVARRSRMETFCDILRVIGAGAEKPTHIMYKANLSWTTLEDALATLVNKEFSREKDGELTPLPTEQQRTKRARTFQQSPRKPQRPSQPDNTETLGCALTGSQYRLGNRMDSLTSMSAASWKTVFMSRILLCRKFLSSMSPLRKEKFLHCTAWRMFSILPLERLSIPVTCESWFTNVSARWLPTKPATPVISIFS